jgi:hypothetical protein
MSLEGPGEVAVFAYDNHSFVLESFLDEEVTVKVILPPGTGTLSEIDTGLEISGVERKAPVFRNRKFGKDVEAFEVRIKPHSFRAFAY